MLVLGAFLFLASMAKAQAPTSIFQLDGNAAPDGSVSCIYSGPCDTWNLLNGTGGAGPIGTGSSAGHSGVRVFINGTSSTDSFTGGGSKDFYPLSKWAYSTSPTPNKDTLNAGYADKFGFPFILAVRGPRGNGLTKEQIIATFARRLDNHPDFEFDTFMRDSKLTVREIRPSNLFGYWRLLRCVNEKDASTLN